MTPLEEPWPSLEGDPAGFEALAWLVDQVSGLSVAARGLPALLVSVRGLSTGALRIGDGRLVEVSLDLREHSLRVETSEGEVRALALADRITPSSMAAQITEVLSDCGVGLAPIEDGAVTTDRTLTYDPDLAARIWVAMRTVDALHAEAGQTPVRSLIGPGLVLRGVRPLTVGEQVVVEAGFVVSTSCAVAAQHEEPVRSIAEAVGRSRVKGAGLVAVVRQRTDPGAASPDPGPGAAPEVGASPGLTEQPLAPASAVWAAEGAAWLDWDALRESSTPPEEVEAFWSSVQSAAASVPIE